MRIIPKTAKVKIEFFKNVSIVDTLIGIVGLALELLVLLTNLLPYEWNHFIFYFFLIVFISF
jgi:hypothetical protein